MQLNNLLEKAIKGILYATPALLLVFYQGTLYPFLTLKTYSFYLFVSVVILLWAVLMVRTKGSYVPAITRVNGAFLLFICVATISGLVSETPIRSIWSTPERLTGIVSLWVFFLYSLALSVFIKKGEWRRYLLTTFWISAVVALFALLQRVSPETFFVRTGARPGGTLGNPAYLAGYLISYLFLGYALLKDWARSGWRRPAVLASLFAVAIAFLGANTRGAILGLIFAAAYLLAAWLYERIKESQGGKTYLAAAGAAILLLGGVVYATSDSPVWAKIPGINRFANFSVDDSSIANRLIEWKIALVGFTEKPILGVGYENFRLISDAQYDPRLLRGGFGDTYFDKPHNVPLEILSTTGAVGFLAYALLWLTIIFAISRSELNTRDKRLAIAAAVAFFIQNCFIFDTFGTHLTFAIAIGALAQCSPPVPFSGLARRAWTLVVPVFGITTACLLIFASISILRGSMSHYRMLNSFIQDMSQEGMSAYKDAQAVYYPYQTLLTQDALSSVVERVRAARDTSIVKHIPTVMQEAKMAMAGSPKDYFIRISLADAKTVLFRLNPEILAGVDEDIQAAELVSPNRQQTFFVRAKVKLLRGDREGAFADMKAAIALDPEAPMPYYNYAKLLAQFTAGKEVLEAFDAAFAKGYKTSSPSELAMLGGYYGDANQYEKAYEFFKQAYELDPSNNEYLAKYGLTSFYTQRNLEAKRIFTHLLTVMPELKDSPNYPVFVEIFKEIGVTPL